MGTGYVGGELSGVCSGVGGVCLSADGRPHSGGSRSFCVRLISGPLFAVVSSLFPSVFVCVCVFFAPPEF